MSTNPDATVSESDTCLSCFYARHQTLRPAVKLNPSLLRSAVCNERQRLRPRPSELESVAANTTVLVLESCGKRVYTPKVEREEARREGSVCR